MRRNWLPLAGLVFLLVCLDGGVGKALAQESRDGDRFFDIGGDSLHFMDTGAPDSDGGTPIVLLGGGSGMDIRQWDLVAPALAVDHRVIRLDPRGSGRSDTPTARYSDAADVIHLLDHLDIERAVIIGVSSSGGLALEIGLLYPDRLTAVVAVAPFVPGFDFNELMRARLKIFSDAALEGREPFLDAMFDDEFFMPAPLHRSVRDRARIVLGENYDKAGGFDPSLPEAIDPPLIERLEEIGIPVLMPVGSRDHPEVQRRNRVFVERIPDAREVFVRDAGHNLHLENPEGFLQAIAGFLRRI